MRSDRPSKPHRPERSAPTKRLLAVLLLAGCGDGGVGPSASESLAIELDAVGAREASVVVGASIQLMAQLRTASGASIGSVASWRSDDPAVAIVDQSGLVTGLSVGAAGIIASAGTVADTLLVSVLSALPEGARCTEGGEDEGLKLDIGESFTTTAAAAPTLCLAGPGEYLIVPFHAAEAASLLRVEIEGVGSGGETASFEERAAEAPHARANDQTLPNSGVDRRLREREARELTPLITWPGAPLRSAGGISANAVPTVGDRIVLNVNRNRTCTEAVDRTARVAAVTDRAVVLADELNPTSGFTDAEYAAFGRAFDELVHPVVRNNFGEPTDIDGNSRVLIFFTRAVNEMTDPGATTYVGGFFFARDLFPRRDTRELRGCEGSNEAELLYVLAPDPAGEVNGNVRTKSFVAARTVSVLAHEMQHLISAGRRMRLLSREQWSEEFWLNEGLSHVAEELVFYAASGMQPRSDVTYGDLRSTAAKENAFDQFQSTNLIRLSAYMKDPAATSPIHGQDLATRGASWAFLRYAADRRGGAESVLWRRLVDGNATGYANLLSGLGASPMSWMHDWTVSLFTDDAVPVADSFRTASWNYRSMMPWIDLNAGNYPLRVKTIRPRWGDAAAHFDLAGGGVGFVRFFVRQGERGTLRTTSGGAAPPASLRLTVVRIR
ncbi:MAG: Ig-like domain-containing protein [Gemmatimonadota bacterium]